MLIKAAVFVVLASLLAWALGGTLWPRPQVAQMDAVTFENRTWNWQLAVGGARTEPSWVRWTMMVAEGDDPAQPHDDQHWFDVAGPVVTDDSLYYAGRLENESTWQLVRIDAEGDTHTSEVPDRFALELQLTRAERSLPLLDAQALQELREQTLKPASEDAAE